MKNHNSLRFYQESSSRAATLGVPFQTMGGDEMKIKDNVNDITPQIDEASPSEGYTGSQKKDSEILTFHKILKVFGYTSDGERNSKRKSFIIEELHHRVEKLQAEIENESVEYEFCGKKIIIPSSVIDIWTRLEFLFG